MKNLTHILLVEDNPKDVALTKAILAKKGDQFELTIAVSGEQALEMLKSSLPDIVLLDYNLPGMNGLAVLEEVRRNKWQVAVVMLTGRGDELVAVEAIKQGADDYLVKDDKLLVTLIPLIQELQSKEPGVSRKNETFLPSQIYLLYIEDNLRDAEITRQYFTKYSPHIHVTLVLDEIAAIDILKSGVQIDCALTDLKLVKTNAIELMKQFEKAGFKLPFVVITGKGSEELAVAAMKLGAYDYISKKENYVSKLPYTIEMAVMKFRKDAMNEKLRQELVELNASLEQKVQERTAALTIEIEERLKVESELEVRLKELQRWYDATLGRETRVVELKGEVNELLKQAGKPHRYSSANLQDGKDG